MIDQPQKTASELRCEGCRIVITEDSYIRQYEEYLPFCHDCAAANLNDLPPIKRIFSLINVAKRHYGSPKCTGSQIWEELYDCADGIRAAIAKLKVEHEKCISEEELRKQIVQIILDWETEDELSLSEKISELISPYILTAEATRSAELWDWYKINCIYIEESRQRDGVIYAYENRKGGIRLIEGSLVHPLIGFEKAMIELRAAVLAAKGNEQPDH